MKPERRQPPQPVADGAITAENYQPRAAAFIRAKGGGVVIRTAECQSKYAKDYPVNEAQWHAWMVYLSMLGVKTAFLRAHGLATVPTAWPEEFDTAAEPSDRFYNAPSKAHTYHGRSLNVSDGLRRMSDAIKPPKRTEKQLWELADKADARVATDPSERSRIVAHHEQRMSELKAHYEANPVGAPESSKGEAKCSAFSPA